MQPADKARVVPTAAPPERAQAIADALVLERPAPCVNVLAVARSTYRWHGEVQRDRECLLLIKTAARSTGAGGPPATGPLLRGSRDPWPRPGGVQHRLPRVADRKR